MDTNRRQPRRRQGPQARQKPCCVAARGAFSSSSCTMREVHHNRKRHNFGGADAVRGILREPKRRKLEGQERQSRPIHGPNSNCECRARTHRARPRLEFVPPGARTEVRAIPDLQIETWGLVGGPHLDYPSQDTLPGLKSETWGTPSSWGGQIWATRPQFESKYPAK